MQIFNLRFGKVEAGDTEYSFGKYEASLELYRGSA